MVARTAEQSALLTALLRTRMWQGTADEHAWVHRCRALHDLDKLDDAQTEWAINRLRALPKHPALPVPDGRYMIDEQRYRIVTDVQGRWAGRASARRIDARGHETVFLRGDELLAVLLAVGADHQSAAREYGLRTGRCGYCHLPLSDPISVAVGAGKTCCEKHGIPWRVPDDSQLAA